MNHDDAQAIIARLQRGSCFQQHAKYSRWDWKQEVASSSTQEGYWDWLYNQLTNEEPS